MNDVMLLYRAMRKGVMKNSRIFFKYYLMDLCYLPNFEFIADKGNLRPISFAKIGE